jgi:hypothetical protein
VVADSFLRRPGLVVAASCSAIEQMARGEGNGVERCPPVEQIDGAISGGLSRLVSSRLSRRARRSRADLDVAGGKSVTKAFQTSHEG